MENPDTRGGVVTWDTGERAFEFEAETLEQPLDIRHGNLYRYDLRTHRHATWTLPRVALLGEGPVKKVLGYSTHTRRAVFWLAVHKMDVEPTRITATLIFSAHAG